MIPLSFCREIKMSSFYVSGKRRASGYVFKSFDRSHTLSSPNLKECHYIPINWHKIPSLTWQKTTNLSNRILMTIWNRSPGRQDSGHCTQLKWSTVYDQKSPLDWMIIEYVCKGKVHQPDVFNVHKTSILLTESSTHLQPCENKLLQTEESFFQRVQGDDK